MREKFKGYIAEKGSELAARYVVSASYSFHVRPYMPEWLKGHIAGTIRAQLTLRILTRGSTMLSITCPHCSHELDDTDLKRLFAQRGSVDGVRGHLKTGDVSSVDFPPPGLTP